MSKPKVVIVCDWLTNMGGAEKVVLSIANAYPNAPIYTSVFTPRTMPDFAHLDIRTTWLQKLPAFLRQRHQLFPVLRAWTFKRLDLHEYDIIISVASAEAKAVRKPPHAVHICYCHTPTRYYWSHYQQYLQEPGFGTLNMIIRPLIPLFVRWMRRLDLQAAHGVDYFIANSTAVAERIQLYYGRKSQVLHPPVDTTRFDPVNKTTKRHGFVALGRQVPYKRIDLAIEACNRLELPLTVYGNGSEHARLMSLAGPTIQFVTDGSDRQVAEALQKAAGYIMPQEEDFGIVQIEAMAAGTPVIAYNRGGARDAVVPGKTGLLFEPQTVDALVSVLQKFGNTHFDHRAIQKYAATFDEKEFITKLHAFVDQHTTIK